MQGRALALITLMGAALYVTHGQFHPFWIGALPLALFFAFLSPPAPRWWESARPFLACGVIVSFFLLSALSLDGNVPFDFLKSIPIVPVMKEIKFPFWVSCMRVLLLLAAGGTVALLVLGRRANRNKKLEFGLFLGILFAVGAAMAMTVLACPSPLMDVWSLHEQATEALLAGKNPYTVDYINIYPPEWRPTLTPFGVNFAYLPGVFIWMAPWKWVGLDTRYSQVFAFMLTAFLFFLIRRRAGDSSLNAFEAYAPAILYLAFPVVPNLRELGWNDGLSVLFFSWAVYSLLSKRCWMFFVAINGVLLLKQYNILFVPFFLLMARRRLDVKWTKLLALSSLGALVIYGVFLALDWRSFLGSLYGLHFLKHDDVHSVFPPRDDAFSLMNWLRLAIGVHCTWFFAVVGVLVAARVFQKTKPDFELSSVLGGAGALALSTFISAPVAFINYYEFALCFYFLMAVTSIDRSSGSQTRWSFACSWSTLFFVCSRALLYFSFPIWADETYRAHELAQTIQVSGIAHLQYSFRAGPVALLSVLIPSWISRAIGTTGFVPYHELYKLLFVALDGLFFWYLSGLAKTGRIPRWQLLLYWVIPLLLGSVLYEHLDLLPALAIVTMLELHRTEGRLRALGALLFVGFLQPICVVIGPALALPSGSRYFPRMIFAILAVLISVLGRDFPPSSILLLVCVLPFCGLSLHLWQDRLVGVAYFIAAMSCSWFVTSGHLPMVSPSASLALRTWSCGAVGLATVGSTLKLAPLRALGLKDLR